MRILPLIALAYIWGDNKWSQSTLFQYCRLSPTSNAATVHRLLLYHWKLPTPTLIISVLGGTGDFELQPKVKQAIKNGLVKAAETTGAWIITNGLNCGASKEVGSALKNAFKRNNRIPCIGITPWGIVQGRENLIGPDVSWNFKKFSDLIGIDSDVDMKLQRGVCACSYTIIVDIDMRL